MKLIAIKFLKFLLVGVSGLIIDFSLTFLCKEKLLLNKYIANSIGFSMAQISNFLLNKYFTYESDSLNFINEFSWFIGISLISLLIYNGIVWICVNKFKVNFYFSKMIAICFITFWNFFAHLYFTFQ